MRDTRSTRTFFVIAATVALAVAGCTSGNSGSSASGGSNNSNATVPTGPVTLTWWHNGSAQPLLGLWQSVADDYHKAHPNVTIKIDPLQNEQFLTKVTAALQTNDPPSIYQQWGSGRMATELTSGKVMDITQAVAPWIGELNPKITVGWQQNGKQYGVPYDQHAVGFWYRKDLFAQAGITTPPTTMDELNADVVKLKAANIPAIAIGSKDRWPDAFYWDYFAVRECPTSVLKASTNLKLNDPCWARAGNDLQTFLATNPFQNAFLGTPAQTGAGSSAGMLANGKAAMELQGDWEAVTMVSLTTDTNLTSKIGWFPFPAVPGGKGDPKVVLGGGDGFSCTTKATGACVDFLKFISSTPVQEKLAAAALVPVNEAAVSSITDPNVKENAQVLQDAPYVQIYFDTSFPFTVGQALDDAVANYFAGKGTPATIVQSVTQSASGGK